MCSIFGYEAFDIPQAQLECEFQKTHHRGPDATRFVKTGIGYLGFHRLSIMGLTEAGMQPFSLGQDQVVCNGEVYGFRQIKERLSQKHEFKSNSDCEIILPLFQEIGCEMFAKLDSEFAMIIYDGTHQRLIAARDPIGIRPLYYGYTTSHHIMFSSEPMALIAFCKKILPFPPGHYYMDGTFVCYSDPSIGGKPITDSIEKITKNIHDKLVKGVEKRLDADAPLGFLLSGGLDSSLVCAIATKLLGKPIETYAIGMREDAIDLKYAKEVASYLESHHHEVIMTKEEVLSSLKDVVRTLGTFDITTIRASIGMYLVCKAIHEQSDIRVLLTGEISDELFGYKYTDFAPTPLAFQEEASKRIRELHMYDVLRADRCISRWSLEARVPFGDLDFVHYVMSIDPSIKMNHYGQGKYLLRRAFDGDLLPNRILNREKAAFSDAVGHSMVDYLKEYAEELYTTEEFEIKRRKFDHARPFTKESLLYRELFEHYYPNQAEMIFDFWMPNKTWPGCNVNDPSARVLSNYGDSAK